MHDLLRDSLGFREKIFADVVPFSWRAFMPSPFTVEAYVELFAKTGFLKAMVNTFYVSLMVVVFGILLNALPVLPLLS
jgi:ABC-type glycerol-3-phosphate transport system permease component